MRLKKLLKFLKKDEYVVLTTKNGFIIDSEWCSDYQLLKRLRKYTKLKVVSFYYLDDNLIVEVRSNEY